MEFASQPEGTTRYIQDLVASCQDGYVLPRAFYQDYPLYAYELAQIWRLTSEQDWDLCARVQRGVNSSAYRPGPLSQTREYNFEAFLRWYLHQLRL